MSRTASGGNYSGGERENCADPSPVRLRRAYDSADRMSAAANFCAEKPDSFDVCGELFVIKDSGETPL